MSALAASNPRVLLRRLRALMASTANPQGLLDQVVRLIASNMVAEVCSIYLARQDESLELFATEGLNREAVHKTRLKVGEGLIGDIAAHARPLSLSDAQSHPLFAYRPETGEDAYHSLMGVPILRGGRVLGVVAVQNQTMRVYSEEETEALQTVAMVLAEMVSSDPQFADDDLTDAGGAARKPVQITGRGLANGLASGIAVLHEPRIEVARTIAEDIESERERLSGALNQLQSSVEQMLSSVDLPIGGESQEILETYRMFANDRGWMAKLEAAIESGLTAEAAIKRVHEETRARMSEIVDPYLRERLADLDDLANRLYRHLSGRHRPGPEELPDNAILVARNMGPAEILDYDRNRLRGILLEEGTSASHVAIVARALEIPVLGGCGNATELIDPNDTVLVDGDHAVAIVRPTAEVQSAFDANLAVRARQQAKYDALRDQPTITLDGVPVSLNINAGLLVDLHHLDDTGADGVGLFRTEFHFMVRASMPSVREQIEYYRIVLDRAGDRPVVFRTLDIGGDKILPYQSGEMEEENPAMGWRAIRIALDRPALLKTQLRALLQAAAGRRLNVMFPMVAEVGEFIAARKIVNDEINRIARLKTQLPLAVKVGTMLEVPSLLWQLPELLPQIDFLSVGSNDLLQFFFACDRASPRVNDRYDPLSPAVLSVLQSVAARCDGADVPISLCGEMAGRPLEAMALLGIGYRSISLTPGSIGPVKDMIRHLDLAALTEMLQVCGRAPERSLRPELAKFAADRGIPI